jgi:hypothetical protein
MSDRIPDWLAWAFRPGSPTRVIYVEYDCRGQRLAKRFTDVAEAHRFFNHKHLQGKRPQVVRVAL